MKKFGIRYKICIVIIFSLAAGFSLLNVISVRILKSEIFSQIKTEDTKIVEAFAKQVESIVDTKTKQKDIQELVDYINSDNEYSYVSYMEKNDKEEVVTIAHSDHKKNAGVVEDEESIAAVKDGVKSCDVNVENENGKRTLNVLCPIYDKSKQLRGAFNIGIPVDEDTVSGITNKATTQLVTMAVIIALSLIGVLSILMEILIVRPIGKFGKTLNMLTGGDLSVKHKVGKLNSSDELDYLSKDFMELINKLQSIVGSIQGCVLRLKNNTKDFAQISSITNSEMESVSRSMDDVAQGAVSQSEQTSTAMARIEELSATLEVIITQITSLNSSTENMQTLTSGTRIVLNELIQANTETKHSVNNIVEQSNNTLQAVAEIDEIIKTIDDIATQTNLLSLNASIEAARAGEAGKGFAVVATEIGVLANNSVESAKQIGDIVERIKNMVEKSASLSNQLDNSAGKQATKLKDTEKSIVTVIDSVSGIADNTKQINDEVGTLEQIKIDIGEIIENLAAVTQESAASAEETASSTSMVKNNVYKIEESGKDIELVAEELNETVNYFR